MNGKPFVMESVLKQNGFLNQINPASVNTLRVNTLIDGDKIVVQACKFRTGVGDQITDNAHSGGILWLVDSETGQIATGSVGRIS